LKRETKFALFFLNKEEKFIFLIASMFFFYYCKRTRAAHSCILQLRILASLFTPCSYATSLALDLSDISRSRSRNTSHGVDRHGFILSAVSTRGWKYFGRCLLSSAPRRHSRALIVVIYGVDVAAIGRFRSVADEDFETSGKIGGRKSARDRVEVVMRSE